MRHCVLPVIFWALISLPALAQKAEVFGGYQYAHFDGGPNANGWNGSATYNITSFLGATADVSGAYGSGLRVHTYTFGPTLSAGKGSISPFVHALFGGFHTTVSGISGSASGLAMFLGGGIDAGMKHGLVFRVVQADWEILRSSGVTDRKNARVSAGIVLRF
ncbi:MAG TPA: hypothetical protein VJX16_09485 [Terriglobales bacterium]|nr:hypothetical protein [Terriglobales bacterium]